MIFMVAFMEFAIVLSLLSLSVGVAVGISFILIYCVSPEITGMDKARIAVTMAPVFREFIRRFIGVSAILIPRKEFRCTRLS